MKNKLPTILLVLSLSTLFGFDVGDEVELDSFLNARTHPNFLKSTQNIKTTLAKGTTGEVLEVKKFSSGNSGIKMKVSSGPKAGESYWVYYNKKNPALSLTDKKHKESTTPENLNPKDSPRAELKRTTAAIRDLEEQAVVDTVKSSEVVNQEIKQVLTPPQADCPQISLQTTTPMDNVAESNYNETHLVEPYRDRPRVQTGHPTCGSSKLASYSVCKRDGQIEEFHISNGGPNKIVSTNEYYINRSFNFIFDDRAKSDIKLLVSDAPDDYTSHTTYSIMLFFPRSVLPAIKQVGNELHVTLPNREVVRYSAQTKEIIGGVLTEGKMAQDPKSKKALPPNLKYTGEGVVITASKSGDLPYGDIELRDGRSAPSITTATVSKKGHKDCKIPSKDLWYNDQEKNNVLIKPEYATDQGLDSFLKKKCGFSLF